MIRNILLESTNEPLVLNPVESLIFFVLGNVFGLILYIALVDPLAIAANVDADIVDEKLAVLRSNEGNSIVSRLVEDIARISKEPAPTTAPA